MFRQLPLKPISSMESFISVPCLIRGGTLRPNSLSDLILPYPLHRGHIKLSQKSLLLHRKQGSITGTVMAEIPPSAASLEERMRLR
jgi:hypothetical protein